MNIGSGLMRLWIVASIAWIVGSAALLRVDLTVKKLMDWNLPTAVSHPGLNNEQLQILQSVTIRLNRGASDNLITELYVIFVPVLVSFVFAAGFCWVWAGFKDEQDGRP